MVRTLTPCTPKTCVSEIIRKVRDKYHHGCVILVNTEEAGTSDFSGQQRFVKITKHLYLLPIIVGAVTLNSFNYTSMQTRCNTKHPIFVVLSVNMATKRFLQDVSPTPTLQYPCWLLFLTPDQTLEDLLEHVYLPFNSHFLSVAADGDNILLTEAYHVDRGGPLRTFRYGLWNATEVDVTVSPLSVFERRPHLHGLVIEGASINVPPIVGLDQGSDGVYRVGGLFGEIWKVLEKRVNFTTRLHPARDNAYGIYNVSSGSWNGMMEMVRSGQVHVAIGDFSMTRRRSTEVGFLFPIIQTSYSVFIRVPSGQQLPWGGFFSPFARDMWLGMGVCVLILTAQWSVLCSVAKRLDSHEASTSERRHPGGSLLSVLRAFLAQGNDWIPEAMSCRLVFLTTYLTALVMNAAYSASLISSLSRQTTVVPFQGLQQLYNDSTYSFVVIKKTAEYNSFQDSNDPMMIKAFIKYLKGKEDLPLNLGEALDHICTKSKYSALLELEQAKSVSSNISCEIMALPQEVIPVTLSPIVAKHSPYMELLSYQFTSHFLFLVPLTKIERDISRSSPIGYAPFASLSPSTLGLLKLRSSGIVVKIRRDLWSKVFPRTEADYPVVSLINVVPVLQLLFIGAASSILFLVVEICCRQYSLGFKNNNKKKTSRRYHVKSRWV
uniref:Ionotropic glutamate receptor L-glutamate and glycine-binding domain-containing protein n=1 Tax=Timema shepardi TaxID=629360 RepID=A0A7R9AZZ9_TIMSH|nr:unnamed protein product [Timema shepardi]